MPTVNMLDQEARKTLAKLPRDQTDPVGATVLAAAQLLKRGQTREALSRFDDASNKSRTANAPTEVLKILVRSWAVAAAWYALTEGLLPSRLEPAEFGVRHILKALNLAKAAGQPDLAREVMEFVRSEHLDKKYPLSAEEEDAFSALRLMIDLRSIEDPFEGWRALAKEISKDWPKGVSAVDAIREQRE